MSDREQQLDSANEQAPDLIEIAQAQIETANPTDILVTAESTRFEADKLKIEVDRLRVDVDGFKNELVEAKELHKIRKRYIAYLLLLIVGWLIVVIVYVGLTGWSSRSGFVLSDAVLIAFITSTTVSVIGLFMVVAKWLFPATQKDHDAKEGHNQTPT